FQGLLRRFRPAGHQRSGGLAADDEGKVDVAPQRRRKLHRLLVPADASDQIFDFVGLLTIPPDHFLAICAAIEKHETAFARTEELERATGRLSERSDTIGCSE